MVRWNGRDNLDFAVLGEKFHFWWAVKKDFTRDWRHWISKCSQLIIPVSKTTVISKFTDTSLLEITADLSFVVTVDSSDVMSAWEVLRHGLNKKRK